VWQGEADYTDYEQAHLDEEERQRLRQLALVLIAIRLDWPQWTPCRQLLSRREKAIINKHGVAN